MKRFLPFLLLLVFACSSSETEDFEVYELFTPVVMSMDEVRESVAVQSPQEIEVTGKIYVKDHLLLVGDEKRGIHIFDNSNPESPQKIAFLAIPGNHDMEMRGNYLYADSYVDLLVFDLSDITAVNLKSREEEVFPYQVEYPEAGDLPQEFNWDSYNFQDGIVVGWQKNKRN